VHLTGFGLLVPGGSPKPAKVREIVASFARTREMERWGREETLSRVGPHRPTILQGWGCGKGPASETDYSEETPHVKP
jgi:hypothetical protein